MNTTCLCQFTMTTLMSSTFPSPILSCRSVNITYKHLLSRYLIIFILQDNCQIFLLTNELTPVHLSESCIEVPFLPGHHYVLLKATDSGVVRSTYCEAQPSFLGTFRYFFEIENVKVLHLTKNFNLLSTNIFISGL